MKLIIEQGWVKDPEESYNKYYKDNGWLFDEDAEAIYYEAEIPFMPIEGQRLGTKSGISIVKYAFYEVEQKEDANFFNRSRIVIKDE